MLVKSTEMVFVNGSRLRVDPVTGLTDTFNYEPKPGKKLPVHLVPAETAKVEKPLGAPGQAPKADASAKGLTRKEIMQQLTVAGISFKATAKSEELYSLLTKSKKQIAPGSVEVPAKETPLGVGYQDVI